MLHLYKMNSCRLTYVLLCLLYGVHSQDDNPPSDTEVPKEQVRLASHPDCSQDFQLLLPKCNLDARNPEKVNNFAALSCVQNYPRSENDLSGKCQNVIWKFKEGITKGDTFKNTAIKACEKDYDHLADCHAKGADHFLPCLVDKKDLITNGPCVEFLTELEAIIFSDYRLIGTFYEKCKPSINKTACGRLDIQKRKPLDQMRLHLEHSQGMTIECLSDHLEDLDDACRHEILRVAEFQAEDYHLDRSLFFACRNDRENFCPKIRAGEGRVYDCLMEAKMKPEMSHQCRHQLTRRQKLIAQNYKASRGLAKGCKMEIKKYNCRDEGVSEDKDIRLTQIMLCLEDAIRNENEVSGTCQAEIRERRRMLMEDFAISPELVTKCDKDIQAQCPKKLGARTIHCLMKAATKHLIGASCENELRLLLREANVAEDWRVDPVLKEACQEVVSASCDVKAGNDAVMSCLMIQMTQNSPQMNRECRNILTEIQYFLARDFTLDPKLYKKCRADAKKFCDADDDWHIRETSGAKLIFPCLVRYLYGVVEEKEEEEEVNEDMELQEECGDQIERVLKQRAMTVNLHPEIEDSCRDFLVQHCVGHAGNGEELKCLQENFDDLPKECQDTVRTYTQLEARNTLINPIIATACDPIIKNHCAQQVQGRDEGAILRCLVEYKMHYEKELNPMDTKCVTAIEHWQILSLKDWKFSRKFKSECQNDVAALCTSTKSKVEVITCLSGVMMSDALDEKPSQISQGCRDQLKFQLLQKHSSIKLNPVLRAECQQELLSHCSGAARPHECLLQLDHKLVSPRCAKKLFRDEREEVVDNSLDHVLMTNCKTEILQHCQGVNGENGILDCLKEAKDDAGFDSKCRLVVLRRTIQQMKDYRLNPRLQKSCRKEMASHCSKFLTPDTEDKFLEGKMIECLKEKFLQNSGDLRPSCKREIENIIRQASRHFKANPVLSRKCPNAVEFCMTDVNYDPKTEEDGGRVEECLKDLFVKTKLEGKGDGPECSREIAKIIEEENLDIHIDPVLYNACALDVSKFCRDVPRGNARQIQCLRNIQAQDAKFKLEPQCEEMLATRLHMFDMALKVVPVQGLNDVLRQLQESPHRNYFFSVGASIFLCIFVFGLCCGRVTKRVRREMKDK